MCKDRGVCACQDEDLNRFGDRTRGDRKAGRSLGVIGLTVTLDYDFVD